MSMLPNAPPEDPGDSRSRLQLVIVAAQVVAALAAVAAAVLNLL
jgi:hypothetical protein